MIFKWLLCLQFFFFFFSELIQDHREPGKVLQAVACHSWLQLCAKDFVSCLKSYMYPEIALVGLFTAWKSTNTANPTSNISLNWVRSIFRHTLQSVSSYLWLFSYDADLLKKTDQLPCRMYCLLHVSTVIAHIFPIYRRSYQKAK